MAEWSKALVLGTSHFGGVGSNPTPVIFFSFLEWHFWMETHKFKYLVFAPVTSVAWVRIPLL